MAHSLCRTNYLIEISLMKLFLVCLLLVLSANAKLPTGELWQLFSSVEAEIPEEVELRV